MIYPDWNSWTSAGFVVYNLVGIPLLFVRQGLGWNPLNHGFKGHNLSGFSVPARVGWFLGYFSALVAMWLTSLDCELAMLPLQARLAAYTVWGHWIKRTLEVLLVHRYSSRVDIDFIMNVSMYASSVAWFQMTVVCKHSDEIQRHNQAAFWLGMGIYLIGIVVNGYHHILLARMRPSSQTNKEMPYRQPQGGLFGYWISPHYIAELGIFLGWAFMLNHLSMWLVLLVTTVHLTSLSHARKQWCMKKMDGFDSKPAILIPNVW